MYFSKAPTFLCRVRSFLPRGVTCGRKTGSRLFCETESEAFSRTAYAACSAFSKGQGFGRNRDMWGILSTFGVLRALEDF